jgi:hypothetical protein
MSNIEENTIQYPMRMYCRVCQREISASTRPPFCLEHEPVYRQRRQEGVLTEKLDARWIDLLDNWRDRPSELDKEVGATSSSTPLVFRQRNGDWLLFLRFYFKDTFLAFESDTTSKASRLPDGLAVNVKTNEIRRYINLTESTMLTYLRGETIIPFQTELATFWGKSDASQKYSQLSTQWEKQLFDEKHRIQISKLISRAEFPVYGLIDRPFSLSLYSLSVWGFSNDFQLRIIGFVFSNSPYATVEIRASHARWYDPSIDWQVLDRDSALHPNTNLFKRYHFSEEEQLQAGEPSTWMGEITIEGVPFTGEFRYWLDPYRLQLFYLKSDETILDGNAHGLSFEELFSLLKGLEALNERNDVLIQYQDEMNKLK